MTITTTATETTTSEPTGTLQVPDHSDVAPPRLAEGVELLGEYRGSGYEQPPFLVRRGDGQVIQMSRLLYLLTSSMDGQRDVEQLAERTSRAVGRRLSADNVRFLLEAKIGPLGVLAATPGSGDARAAEIKPLLALRARATLLTERGSGIAAAALRPLFFPPVVAAVGIGILVLDSWLFLLHGLGGAVRQLLVDPLTLLVLIGLTLLSAIFHECGHATACRYGGGRPGRIGVGIYLIFPSFFTDVTDSYRLGRAGRLRTDLGGLYFNLVFLLALGGAYAATGQEILLLAVAVIHLEMIEQLLPFVRFDGYFIVSDLAGVPDLFARMWPILRSAARRQHRDDPRVRGLRRSARLLVTCWTALTVPLLVVNLGYLALHLPRIDGALWESARLQAAAATKAIAAGSSAQAALDLVGVGLLALSLAGMLYLTTGIARQAIGLGRHWVSGRTKRRPIAAGIALLLVTGLVAYWTSHHEFSNWHL